MVVPRILLVGAYERDNFGDLLFLELTKRRLGAIGAVTVVSAPISADMRALVGEFVIPTGLALQTDPFDTVWVVGGEIGTTTLGEALRFSLSAADHETLAAAPGPVRRAAIAALTVDHESPGAYVPAPSGDDTTAAPVVLHSVGLAGLAGAAVDDPRMVSISAAAGLTVRDGVSSELLAERGVRHRLAPDLVQTIRKHLVPASPDPSSRVLVQASTRSLDLWGDDAFVDAVVSLSSDHPVTLFAAGTATGHDSIERYEEVRATVLERSPTADVSISSERDPWRLAREIAESRAWIGTSLHGRIVASAFDRPRVSLANVKVAAYADTWDPSMPSDVLLADASAALATALAVAELPEAAVGARLSDLAATALDEAVAAHVA